MRKFILLCALSLTLSSCATEAETRAALVGAAVGMAVGTVLADESSRAPRHASERSNRRAHDARDYEDD
jgi:hypothetical protein